MPDQDAPPTPPPTPPHEYPPYVVTDADRKRWDAARAVAMLIFGDDPPQHVWQATRSLYNSSLPT